MFKQLGVKEEDKESDEEAGSVGFAEQKLLALLFFLDLSSF